MGGPHIHLRGHADTLARRQLGLLNGVTGLLGPGLGLGKTKTNTPNKPTQPAQPPGGSPPTVPNPGTTVLLVNAGPTPTGTPVSGGGGGGGGNGGSGGGGSNGGGGGGSIDGGVSNGGGGGSGGGGGNGSSGGGGDPTASGAGPANTAGPPTSRTQTRASGSPSGIPLAGGTGSSNEGPSGSGSGPNTGTVNVGVVGGDSSGPVNGGSSDLNPGTGTTVGPPGSGPSTNVNTLSDGKSSTPAGAIAAAVILSLLFVIAIVVFILRKRSNTRRDEHAIKWWFTRNRASQSYGDNEALNCGTSSRRSSFATTHDHSKASFLASGTIPPLPPPMAEIGRPNGTDPALVLDISHQRQFSIGSANSHNSFFVVHHRESLQQEHSASVMSCTESFPFPKPPPSPADHTMYSRTSSPQKRESVQYLPSPTRMQSPISNPFADNNPFDDSSPLPSPVSGTS
jgi:hypothetical protein